MHVETFPPKKKLYIILVWSVIIITFGCSQPSVKRFGNESDDNNFAPLDREKGAKTNLQRRLISHSSGDDKYVVRI